MQVSVNDLDVNVTLSEYKMRHNKINTSKILDSACGSHASIHSFLSSFIFFSRRPSIIHAIGRKKAEQGRQEKWERYK